jgi:hypothetical protein
MIAEEIANGLPPAAQLARDLHECQSVAAKNGRLLAPLELSLTAVARATHLIPSWVREPGCSPPFTGQEGRGDHGNDGNEELIGPELEKNESGP